MLRIFCKAILVSLICLGLLGCAPGPPAPPLLGGPDMFGLGWLVIALIALVVVILWKRSDTAPRSQSQHLSDALNNISDRVRNLEDKLEKLEREKKP